MPDLKISQLPAGAVLTGAEPVPMDQSGVTKQTTTGAIASAPGLWHLLANVLRPNSGTSVFIDRATITLDGTTINITGGTVVVSSDTEPISVTSNDGTITIQTATGDVLVDATAGSATLSAAILLALTGTLGVNIDASGGNMTLSGAGVFITAGTLITNTLTVQQTVNTPVVVITSVSGNDDPTESTVQFRVTTVDATVTTLGSINLPANETTLVEARVIARRTGGAAGTAQDGAAYELYAVYQFAAQIGTTQQTVIGENQAGWDATLDFNTNAARIRVTGAVDNNIVWHATVRYYSVGT